MPKTGGRYNLPVIPRNLHPMRLSRRAQPFDSDQHIFELKIDGFRALAHIGGGEGELVSRNGNTFCGFAELASWIAKHLRAAFSDEDPICILDAMSVLYRN